MNIFERIKGEGFEQVVHCSDPSIGLRAIISLHSTVLGPGVGGCRMWAYQSEDEALEDVLRLSRGMTYKSALAGLNWGGGKSVIIGDPRRDKSPRLLKRFGEFVNRLDGNYVTAKDVGIHSEDLKIIKQGTKHVLGIEGEAHSSGDPSPATAIGVFHGIKACAKKSFGTANLSGVRIAVQGLGAVARTLIGLLEKEGAILVGTDVNAETVDFVRSRHKIEIVKPEAIFDVPCEIFAPCALGAVINDSTIARIRARVVAGAANNQLAEGRHGEELMRRKIIYAPDYAINAGGIINIYYEKPGSDYDKAAALRHVEGIGKTIETILNRAQEENRPTSWVADRMAEERIEKKRAQ